MEIIEEKNKSARTAPLGALSLVAGMALLGWSLLSLPHSPAYGFPWMFLLAVGGLKLILLGGRLLDSLLGVRNMERFRAEYRSKLPFALMVIVAGVMLLGFNSGVLTWEWRRVFFSWQMLLIVIGLTEYTAMRITSGTVLVAVGGFFIVRRLSDIYPDIALFAESDMWWPVLLIVAGLLVLGSIFSRPRGGHRRHSFGRSCRTGGNRGDRGRYDGRAKAATAEDADGADDAMAAAVNRTDTNAHDCCRNTRSGSHSHAKGVIDIEVVFGGCEQVYLDPVFRGGKISTLFGGVELDLRRTSLPEGDTYLRIESIFGGVEIDMPEEWLVELRSESIFGGFNDKRLPPVDGSYTEGRRLIVSTSCIFGGGEIK